jgi:N-acylneuraminate cytidylyltransferase
MAIAVIPARKGSQRIPDKNVKHFKGKPMIRHAIDTAIESGLFEQIYVSTDYPENEMNIYTGGKAIVIQRPDDLAVNSIGTQEVARHIAMTVLRPKDNILCVIYATTPLMCADDLNRGFDNLLSSGQAFSFSVGTEPLCDAGQFYFGEFDDFIKRTPLFSEYSIMTPISSDRVCDINIQEDWDRAEQMYDKLHGNIE